MIRCLSPFALVLFAAVVLACGGARHEVPEHGSPDDLPDTSGLDVDQMGRLWVLDNGSVDLASTDVGVPKIVVYDAATGDELFRHVFGPDAAPGFANDIVYDDMHGFAYITDTGMGASPGIVVYDVLRDLSWRVLNDHPALLPGPDAVDPLALSPDGRTLLLGGSSADACWAIPTLALRNRSLADADRAAQIEQRAVDAQGGCPIVPVCDGPHPSATCAPASP